MLNTLKFCKMLDIEESDTSEENNTNNINETHQNVTDIEQSLDPFDNFTEELYILNVEFLTFMEEYMHDQTFIEINTERR